MKNIQNHIKALTKIGVLATCLAWAGTVHAAQLINFPFNEGTGLTTASTVGGFTGLFGDQGNPANSVELTETSPSGLPGDKSITPSGSGFLIAGDTNKVLAVTNGPITVEAWVYMPDTASGNLGMLSYGNSYKMGLRGGYQVFTLLGLRDITNSTHFVFGSQWTHVAAAWNPGVGVNFYVNGEHSFVEYTNAAAARTPLHHFLSLGNEGLGNSWIGSLDRIRIHNALLDGTQLDSDPLNPKAPLASTLVAYNFNETALPSTNAIAPALPAVDFDEFVPTVTTPEWTNDTPSGLAGDFALAFSEKLPFKEVVSVDLFGSQLPLDIAPTNYALQAWVKLPTGFLEDRRVIYTTRGPAMRVALSVTTNRTMHTTILGVVDAQSSVAIPNDGRWHHLGVVMENYENFHFYLDGILRQSVPRTATGTPNTNNFPASMVMGKESDTRYFHGLLDRVIINNDALNASTLDFPAIPGLATFPTIASHPTNLTVASGDTAVFTAAPESSTAATYQWFYRTNLADPGVAVSGETTVTLTLNGISEADLGYYSLQVSNAVGVTESYAAKLSFPLDLSPGLIDFDAPTYTSGLLTGQNGWTSTDNGINTAVVLTSAEIADYLDRRDLTIGQPTKNGSQALLFTGAGSGGTVAAGNLFRSFTGLENESNVTLSLWFRALAPGNTAAPIGNAFLRMQNATGVNAAGFRVGPNLSIDYGLVGGAWVPTGILADPTTWYQITMQLDYTARTYDFFVDGVKINTEPIPFYTSTSDKFTRINLFRGATQAGFILDDLNIAGPDVVPTLGIRQTESGVVLFWPSSVTDYVLEATGALPAAGPWTPVSHSTVGDENQATVQPGAGNQFYRLKK